MIFGLRHAVQHKGSETRIREYPSCAYTHFGNRSIACVSIAEAEGMVRAAEKIGKGSEKYAFHIKGNDLPLHDGRGKTGMAMGYALSSTGADHVECPHDVAFQCEGFKALSALGITESVRPLDTDADKLRFFHLGQLAWGINNLLSICNFCSVPIHAMTTLWSPCGPSPAGTCRIPPPVSVFRRYAHSSFVGERHTCSIMPYLSIVLGRIRRCIRQVI